MNQAETVRNRTPSRGTPPASSPAARYQPGLGGSSTGHIVSDRAKITKTTHAHHLLERAPQRRPQLLALPAPGRLLQGECAQEVFDRLFVCTDVQAWQKRKLNVRA